MLCSLTKRAACRRQNIPEVKNSARQASLGTVVLRAGEKTFTESRTQAVESRI